MIERCCLFQVTIGPRTVIHPKARILAEAGPIFIGEGNLIGRLPTKQYLVTKVNNIDDHFKI